MYIMNTNKPSKCYPVQKFISLSLLLMHEQRSLTWTFEIPQKTLLENFKHLFFKDPFFHMEKSPVSFKRIKVK